MRGGLRFIRGERVFMPHPPVVDRLEQLGLVERSPEGRDVGMPDRYRVTPEGRRHLEGVGL